MSTIAPRSSSCSAPRPTRQEPMRATRAYLVGLGTSGVLLAGVVTLLLVASAVVAFRGAMPATIAAGIRDLVLEDPAPGLRLDGPARTAARAAPAAAGVGAARAAAPGGGLVGTSGGEATGGSGTAPARPGPKNPAGPGPKNENGGRDSAPSGPTGQTGSGASSPPAPSAAAPARRPVADLNQGGGDTVGGVTGGAGETVAQVSPELGKTVGETGEGVGDVARGLDVPR